MVKRWAVVFVLMLSFAVRAQGLLVVPGPMEGTYALQMGAARYLIPDRDTLLALGLAPPAQGVPAVDRAGIALPSVRTREVLIQGSDGTLYVLRHGHLSVLPDHRRHVGLTLPDPILDLYRHIRLGGPATSLPKGGPDLPFALTLAQAQLPSGSATSGVVELTGGPAPVDLHFTLEAPGGVGVPAEVEIPRGKSTVAFPITAQGPATVAEIKVTLGRHSHSAQLAVVVAPRQAPPVARPQSQSMYDRYKQEQEEAARRAVARQQAEADSARSEPEIVQVVVGPSTGTSGYYMGSTTGVAQSRRHPMNMTVFSPNTPLDVGDVVTGRRVAPGTWRDGDLYIYRYNR